MNISVAKGTAGDLETLFSIRSSVHRSDHYRRFIPRAEYQRFEEAYAQTAERKHHFFERMQHSLELATVHVYIASYDGEPCGYIRLAEYDTEVVLDSLFVVDRHQGKGIGRELMKVGLASLSRDKPIRLDVIEGNESAIRLYTTYGFVRTTTPRGLAFYGAPLIRMYKY